MMRAGMGEVWRQDFVLAALAKGLSRRRIVVRHVARNALLPLVTMLGLQAATMLGGSVVIESVFAIPGFGRLAQEAVAGRDAPLLMAVIIISAVLVIIVNLLVDIAYAWPRSAGRQFGGRRHMRAFASRFLSSPEGVAGAVLLLLLALTAVVAPLLLSGDPAAIVGRPLQPPFAVAEFPLGTDQLGRDVLTRLVYGSQASLTVGFASAVAAIVVGALVGTVAGLAGGLVDEALMRVVDAFQIVPGLPSGAGFRQRRRDRP